MRQHAYPEVIAKLICHRNYPLDPNLTITVNDEFPGGQFL